MTGTRYRIDGMTCQGCANAVSRAVEGTGHGVRALVDLGAATVHVEGPVTEAQVRTAVEDAGFTFFGSA
ncbi:MAG: hypothetical protein RLY86_3412 [Pseudomonadota bacterium]